MQPSGYSGTPLAKKLGIKEGFTVRLVNEPTYYFELFSEMPENVIFLKERKTKKNLVHYFTKKSSELHRDIVALRHEIHPNGMIWISWPKKSSKIVTDITEDVVRALALSKGLVDIKV